MARDAKKGTLYLFGGEDVRMADAFDKTRVNRTPWSVELGRDVKLEKH